ncbi:MAG: EAL domain-containing protein [Actinoplanes sp.]
MGALWERVSGSSRLLRASGALLLISMVLVGVNAVQPVLPWFALWLPGVAGSVLLVVSFRRTAKTADLPEPTRRFWRHLHLVGVLVSLGNVAQAATLSSGPDLPNITHGQLIFHGSAVLVIIYALLRLPFGKQTRGEMFRVVLDAGTTMLGCAVFMWHFSTRYTFEDNDPRATFISLALTTLALVAVFAVAKFMLASHSYLESGTLRLIGLAVLVGAVSPTLRPLIESVSPHLHTDMIGLPAIYFVAIWAAEIQQRADYGPRRGTQVTSRRSFSVLPYLAVVAVDALLINVTWHGDDPDERVVVASAVLLTGLVVLRQVTAFMDNGRLLRRLDHGATHDALTQLPNRVLFHERLVKALTAPGERPVAVALIDLDDFKEVNDTLGHEIGDLLLIAVAQRLAGCVRTEDTVARLGGDEFVVVLDGADPAAADLAARRMIDALRDPVLADGHELPIRASIGIADGASGDDPSVLLRHADVAMYAAKNIPGTASLHYDSGMATAGADHAHLGAELREALDSDQLFLLYQPIVGLADGRVRGAEALVRWAHPAHGTLTPDAFLPVAERTGLLVPLGRWVLHTALRQLAAWPATHLRLNVSARELREPGFAADVAAALAQYGIAADRLTLELNEPALDENLPALRALGVRLAFDDFGTGDSPLTLLDDCPVDELKLDPAFTQADPDGRAPMADAVLQLASTLGMSVVAEGVETAEQADRLRSLGYAAAQGHHLGRPQPADKFGELLGALTPA